MNTDVPIHHSELWSEWGGDRVLSSGALHNLIFRINGLLGFFLELRPLKEKEIGISGRWVQEDSRVREMKNSRSAD